MPGILDPSYGVEDTRREHATRRIVLAAIAAAILAGMGYFYFRTWSEERILKGFFSALERKDFQGAYAMWGCTQDKPCRYYDPDRFNQDWGPATAYAHGAAAKIDNIDFCDAGVVFNVSYPNADPVALWVERSSNVISFAPWPRCPGRHWEFGKFFKSLFS